VGRKRSGDDFPLVATSAAIITTTAAACVIHGYDWQKPRYRLLLKLFPHNTSAKHTHKTNKSQKQFKQKCQNVTEKQSASNKKQENHLCYIR
jgi:hypothetical protein